MPQRTPFYDIHAAAGASLVDFAGWLMPVQYSGIIEEHGRVRTGAGVFDIGHMGQIEVFDEDVLQNLTTNDIKMLPEGMGQYSFMCDDNGCVIDDLIVYRLTDRMLVISNAVNSQKVFNIINGRDPRSNILYGRRTAIAAQGPLAVGLIGKIMGADLSRLKHRQISPVRIFGAYDALASRSGYSGEDGIELFFDERAAAELWGNLVSGGFAPCGLGSRDVLRIEAALPLYGHEIDSSTTPLEAGFGRFIKFEKGDFSGRQALAEQKNKGMSKKLVGFELAGRAVPRQGHEISNGDEIIGSVTSGTYSPTLKKPIGMAYISMDAAGKDTPAKISIRDRSFDVSFVSMPFYRRGKL